MEGMIENLIFGIIILAVCAITGVCILYIVDNVGSALIAQAAVTAPDAVANMNTTINTGHSAVLGFFTWFGFFVVVLALAVITVVLPNMQHSNGGPGRR